MSEYIVELDGKHSIALNLAFVEEMRGGDFIRGEIVRCRDCKCVSIDEFGIGWCIENCREVKPWDFCTWGERETINKTGDFVTRSSGKVVGE